LTRPRPSPPPALREQAVPYRVAAEGNPPPRPLTCLDLFCGCGGFTLGMQRAGFQVLAAVDFNPQAVATLRANLVAQSHPDLLPVSHALERDLTAFPTADLAALLGTDRVDVIVGGPPCQGFSTVRQRDGANHGGRLIHDPRRHLYREFLRFVDAFQPKVFVMENVLGLRTAAGGEYFTRVQQEARALGYRVHGHIEDAWELGVPQKRRRQLIIGVRGDLPGYFPPDTQPAPRAEPRLWLGAAIGDLPILRAGGGEDERDYDLGRRLEHVEQHGDSAFKYLCEVLEIDHAAKLTNHIARPHSERDLRDFLLLKEGENSAVAMRDRGVVFEFPYDKSSFKDRYTRQSRWHPCSTIVAHLSKDGLMFIHPTQNRSLTPREAARIQSFPDWFRFPKARTNAFRLIGNAVPPLVSESIGIAVKSYIEKAMKKSKPIKSKLASLPKDEKEAVSWLLPLIDLDSRALRKVPDTDFKRAWCAIAFIYAGLHPDSALEHGDQVANDKADYAPVSAIEPRLANPYYEQSGWPVVLGSVSKEAWRRNKQGQLKDEEFYCCDAQRAGMSHRNPEIFGKVGEEREMFA